ncbi:LysR family transcriptional regulator [Bradyrhizobium sp. dw_78]|uniref:LysR family transcriptional regulator n=1 Tax=Bradyrhizobium sp. dw_78 TaxID=2719793 RepID=UPI001BD473D2|nr:LysR family transcriptional regulator [Bradyrhizobium sp. dw_78]
MSHPSLSHLSAFAAVARSLSFQRAGAETGMSTSAVSYAIRGLEERLGVSLFHRTTRSVALTEAGRRLFERLQPALRDVGDAVEEMNNFRTTPTGTLRINSSRSAASLLIAPLIKRFLSTYPDIHLELVDDDGFTDVVAAGFDAGVRLEESIHEDMVAVRLGPPQRFAVIGAPEYFSRYGIPKHPNDLHQHRCIRYRFPSGRIFCWEFEKDSVSADIDVKGQLTLSDQRLMLGSVLDGIGLGYIFEGLVIDEIEAGRLVRCLEDWCPSFPGFMLYYPRQRRMPSALRAFIDLAKIEDNGPRP